MHIKQTKKLHARTLHSAHLKKTEAAILYAGRAVHKIQTCPWADSARLEHLQEKYGKATVATILQACEKMWQLSSDLGISKHDLFNLSLFIETKLDSRIENKNYHISKYRTNLAKTIDYDPKTKRIFIQDFGLIGKGWHKKVYRSIMYDSVQPEFVAQSVFTIDEKSKKEIAIVKNLSNEKGIARTYAVIERTDTRTNAKIANIMQKMYADHSLYYHQHVRGELTKSEMMVVAKDLIYGLEVLHNHDLVHRDLHGGNILLDRTVDGVAAAIIDFGQTKRAKDAALEAPCIEVPRRFNPPDAFWRAKKTIDAKATDVYALGLNLYHLYYGVQPEWAIKEKFSHINKMSDSQKVVFRKKLIKKITQTLDKRRCDLKDSHDLNSRFVKLILRMCDPSPFTRPSAAEIRKEFDALLP